MTYVFEEPLNIKIELLSLNQVQAEKLLNIVDIIARPQQLLEFSIGHLFVKVEEVRDSNSVVSLQVQANIDGKFWQWRPQYYFIISREVSAGEAYEIYRSENATGDNSKWKPFTVPYNFLGSNAVKISVMNTSHELIGESRMNFSDLLEPGRDFVLTKQGRNKGLLKISWSELQVEHNFIDHLREGLNFKIIIAVDYTSSNMPYLLAESNHYLSESKFNPYEACIHGVLTAFEVYNKEKLVDMYGFGGIPKGQTEISHCFKLGTAKSLNEALEVYRKSLPDVQLSRPTILNWIIEKAQKKCVRDPEMMNYYAVFIITDGDIHDYPDTSTQIVKSCKYPLSFVIIGIGNNDFRNMIKLDSDEAPLTDREGRIADRDIVQFVPFNQYRNHRGLFNAKLLEEIPEQVCGYMKKQGGYGSGSRTAR